MDISVIVGVGLALVVLLGILAIFTVKDAPATTETVAKASEEKAKPVASTKPDSKPADTKVKKAPAKKATTTAKKPATTEKKAPAKKAPAKKTPAKKAPAKKAEVAELGKLPSDAELKKLSKADMDKLAGTYGIELDQRKTKANMIIDFKAGLKNK